MPRVLQNISIKWFIKKIVLSSGVHFSGTHIFQLLLFQDNPFRPEGELSKEADAIVGAIKEGRHAITPPLAHSPPLPSLSPSSPNELDGENHTLSMDSPDGVDRALTSEYQTSPTAGTKEAAVVKVSKEAYTTDWPRILFEIMHLFDTVEMQTTAINSYSDREVLHSIEKGMTQKNVLHNFTGIFF
jgi:hypothetical protein